MRNIPSDQEILAAINDRAATLHDPHLPPGFRCDMSRVGSIRRCWERAVEEYKQLYGLNPVEALARIEAALRSPANAPELHVERRDA